VGIRVSASHTMQHPWRYRRTAAIALGWEAGFRPRGRRGIVEIHDCPISHPLIGALAAQLNEILRAGRIPPYHGKVWLDCTVVGTSSQPRLQLVIQGIEGLTLESHPELPDVAAVVAACQSVVSVSFRHRSGEVLPLIGELQSRIAVAGSPMWVPAGAFFQTNLEMLDRLIKRIKPVLAERAPRHVADVYGGAGTFALAFAIQVEHMTLVELDASAVAAARRTAGDRGLENISFVSQHAEKALPDLAELDLVVVDPPRSGLGPVVTDALAASDARSIIYVSCSPSSLARDLARLQELGFSPVSLEMFDFYPQTYHVECLAILDRQT
jgi:23S rRNA (uracil1939-C5)-methyltransferase